ncbi:hypothetical protein KY361_02985 [Candidatus Woesearchaeota archaeon]|nr:hypothetical protein [Candidatus Woesearchaeota archaeon]
MKKIISLFLVMLMAWPLVLAEVGTDAVTMNVMISGGEEAEIPEEIEEEAGITPDNPLWGLERAAEQVSLALTFDKSAKAKKGLAHARERLVELQVMMAARKLRPAVKAQKAHNDAMEGVNNDIASLGSASAAQELEDEIEFEGLLYDHRTIILEINNMKLKMKGLTAVQQAQLNGVIASVDSSAMRAQLSVRAKKDKTKLRIKATNNLSDEQLNALEEQARAAAGEGAKAKVVGRKAESKAKGKLTAKGASNGKGQSFAPATEKGKNR